MPAVFAVLDDVLELRAPAFRIAQIMNFHALAVVRHHDKEVGTRFGTLPRPVRFQQTGDQGDDTQRAKEHT